MSASQAAAEWLRQGQACESQGTPESLAHAVACYDRALSLLRHLAPTADPPLLRDLAVAWMNRGNALQKIASTAALADAVTAYDEAISLLEKLPVAENPAIGNSLGAAWLNRGHALQPRGPSAHADALRSYRTAIAVLQSLPPAADRSIPINLAAAWMNLANALLSPPAPACTEARTAAQTALSLVAPTEQTDSVAAEVGLKSRRVLCDAIGHLLVIAGSDALTVDTLAHEAADAADDGLALVRHWETRGVRDFRPLAARLYYFGAQLCLIHQPHFLAEFLLEPLDPAHSPGALTDEPALHTFAAEFLAHALQTLRARPLVGLTHAEQNRLLETSRDLQAAAHRLAELRPPHSRLPF